MEDGKTLDLLKPEHGDFYLIRNYVRNPTYGYHEGISPLIRVEGDDMRGRGLAIILENLSWAHQPPLGGPGAEAPKPGEKRGVDLGYLKVGVGTVREHIHLVPMRRKQGGFVGIDCPDIIVSPDCTNEEFVAAVARAFQICRERPRG